MDMSLSRALETFREYLNIQLFQLGEEPITPFAVLVFLVVVVLSFVVSKYSRHLFSRRYGERLDAGVEYSIRRFLHYGVILLGVFIAFETVGIDLSSLTFILATLGVGIGFGLQNVTSNFISGLILLIERPIAVGDLVTVGEEIGTVQRINMRATEVRTVDNLDMIIPNSSFIEENVVNWAHGDDRLRLRVPIGVAYGTDAEKVRDVLLELAGDHDDVLEDPEPTVLFQEFDDSSLNFELRVWVPSPRYRLTVKSELNYRIQDQFEQHDIEIPFPQRDLHLRSADPVTVREETD